MLRRTMLTLSRHQKVESLAKATPYAAGVINRFVGGDNTDEAVATTADVTATGRLVSLDYLGEDTLDDERARQTAAEYLRLLDDLGANGLTAMAEVSVKLSALGQSLPGHGEQLALDLARQIARKADDLGTTITVDMEDHTTTDSTLLTVVQLREDFPSTGAVLQAYLRRTENDCAELAQPGSRIRLCKGAYKEPESVAFQSRHDIDLAYVRCLRILMQGEGYPMVATHDPRLIEIGQALAIHNDRAKDSYEFQMLYGVRPKEQERIAEGGERMRVYVPYGDDWYGYMTRRMAEKPANLALFAKSMSSKK